MDKEQSVILLLFKDREKMYNSRSISKQVGMSHPGAFKVLKRLEKQEIVRSRVIGKAVIYSLNFQSPMCRVEVDRALTIEAQSYKRWIEELKELEGRVEFVVLFGSVIRNEKAARDIDVLVVARRDKVSQASKIIAERRKISYRQIHLIIQSPVEFKKDVLLKNKAIMEILRTGIVLFGQDKIRQMLTQ